MSPKKGLNPQWVEISSEVAILISMPLRFHKFNFTTILVISMLHT